jgi:hypothetical protein
MMIGSRKINPGCPSKVLNTGTVEPRVAAKPRPTETMRYQGATTLRSRSPRMSMISRAAMGNTKR